MYNNVLMFLFLLLKSNILSFICVCKSKKLGFKIYQRNMLQ